jgi:single-stranded-DNA-specific exonuclease
VRRAVAEGLLVKGGGHAMAAGVTLRAERLASFRAYLEQSLGEAVQTARAESSLLIDGAVSAGGANLELIATMAKAGPFGAGNPEPVLALPAHTLVYADKVGEAHVRARLKAGDGAILDAIAFRALNQPLGNALLASRGQRIHAAGTLAVDRWNGSERVQFRLSDLAPADPAR